MAERMDIMKTWSFESGLRVVEHHPDGLRCYDGEGTYLGFISCDENGEEIAAALDAGHDPVAEGWEPGNDHCCTMDGWAYNSERDDYGKGEGYDDGDPDGGWMTL